MRKEVHFQCDALPVEFNPKMEKEMKMKENQTIHPALPMLKGDLDKGKLTRREFLRTATLLGMSAVAASQLAGLALPGNVFAAKPKRGGILRVAVPVQKLTHPAQFSWASPSNQTRQVAEYLTWTDGKNITHPYLLKNWAASADLLTWTLNLRKGIKFNNGDNFTADDVVFTMTQWKDKDVGSSMLGLMAYLDPSGIEKVNDYQVKLHLNTAEIAVPEHLFHYPGVMLNHKTFEGDFAKRPHRQALESTSIPCPTISTGASGPRWIWASPPGIIAPWAPWC